MDFKRYNPQKKVSDPHRRGSRSEKPVSCRPARQTSSRRPIQPTAALCSTCSDTQEDLCKDLARRRAKWVSVDSLAKAISLTDANGALNFPGDTRHTSSTEDAFKYLDTIEKGVHDLIILDPPAFAKHRSVLRNGLQGYRRLNAKAFDKIAPGSILFTFSCLQAQVKSSFA